MWYGLAPEKFKNTTTLKFQFSASFLCFPMKTGIFLLQNFPYSAVSNAWTTVLIQVGSEEKSHLYTMSYSLGKKY
jgi:hypothetical protein